MELPHFTVFVVTLASLLYCSEKIGEILSQVVTRRLSRRLAALEKLHETTYREIQTEFDFWWSGEPQKAVRRALVKQVPLPEEVVASMPPGMLDLMIEQEAESCRKAALHLAVHARMAKSEDAIIDTLSNIHQIQEQVAARRMERDNELERTRTALVSVGIDIYKLEAHFAS